MPPTVETRPARFGGSPRSRSTATRSSPPAAAACSCATRADWITRARYLATQARDPAPHYQHSEIGFNYRMSNLLAAVGRGQLRNLESRRARAGPTTTYYRSQFARLPGIDVMPEATYGRRNCWLTCITVDPRRFGATREDLRSNSSAATSSPARCGSRCTCSRPSAGAPCAAARLPHDCSNAASACRAGRASRRRIVSVSSTRSRCGASGGHRIPAAQDWRRILDVDAQPHGFSRAKNHFDATPALPVWLLRYRGVIIWAFHMALAMASTYIAFLIRFDGAIPRDMGWSGGIRSLHCWWPAERCSSCSASTKASGSTPVSATFEHSRQRGLELSPVLLHP